MQESSDAALLEQYARHNSEAAFAALVSRHVNLVYSVALRHVRNPAHAQDVTQAVFIILAGKTRKLRNVKVLSGWLFHATRLTAANFIRSEMRRVRREQEAHMQSLLNQTQSEPWPQIAPLLDSAVARLNDKDRDAILLRYFEGKSFREVGLALGSSQEAAEKRVNRAVDKLRRFFSRSGVDSTSRAITDTISAHAVQPAPIALANTATAAGLTKGAGASMSTLSLAKATLAAMKIKIAGLTAAALLFLAGAFFFLGQSSARPPVASAALVPPIHLTNDAFIVASGYNQTVMEQIAIIGEQNPAGLAMRNGFSRDDRFENGLDPEVRRAPDSPPAGHIKSLVTPALPDSGDFLKSISATNPQALQSSRYIRYEAPKGSAISGKRVRVSGWVKTRDVANWAGATLVVINPSGHIFANDAMTDRPIHGDNDWRRIELVADVPSEPCAIYFGPTLYGTGELWVDDFQIDVVPSATPITDDRIWHVWSPNPGDYSQTTDYNNTHDGHPTLCLAYAPDGAAPAGSWMWWGEDIRDPGKYLGHTVRMTAWIKTEKVSGRLTPNLRPKGANFRLLSQYKIIGPRITGTTDWAQHSTVCFIPKDTQCLDTGFAFTGSGRVWIDMSSLKYEIIDDPKNPKRL